MACNVFECKVTMRDGVRLHTIVQSPEPEGKFPVIVYRSPYCPEQTDLEAMKNSDTHGYVLLTQQCRGTAQSEGEFQAYLHERNDGLDFLEWVRKQPFYNGEIYLYGGSYCASVHFAYLDTNPPDVKAAFLAVQDTERYNIIYRNGFYKTGLHGRWVVNMHKKNQSIERNFTINSFRTMPWKNITQTFFNEFVPYIEESFLHPDSMDPYWQTPEGGSHYSNACNKCSIPIFLVTSFYDIYAGGVMDMWEKLSPERRKNCAFIVTPFDHGYYLAPSGLTEETQDFRDGLLSEIVPDHFYTWFDHFRKGTKLPLGEKGKITYYRLWDHKWIVADDLKNGPVEEVFYLTGAKTLEKEKPLENEEVTYTYNPYDPAGFEGGVCHNFGGMKFQDPPNSRHDILSFLSPPFEEERCCEGKIQLELSCRSTAEDSCFYLRLNLVRNGKALPLRDDIDSLCRVEKEYSPTEERILKFTLPPHAFKIHKGDQLRLDISSSCVPHFQVHTNRKGIQALQETAVSCRNTVIAGKSFVKLFLLEE